MIINTKHNSRRKEALSNLILYYLNSLILKTYRITLKYQHI